MSCNKSNNGPIIHYGAGWRPPRCPSSPSVFVCLTRTLSLSTHVFSFSACLTPVTHLQASSVGLSLNNSLCLVCFFQNSHSTEPQNNNNSSFRGRRSKRSQTVGKLRSSVFLSKVFQLNSFRIVRYSYYAQKTSHWLDYSNIHVNDFYSIN